MGRSQDQSKRSKRDDTTGRRGGSPTRPAHGAAPNRDDSRATPDATPRNRPILRFVSIFVVCMGLFYVVRTRPTVEERIFSPYLQANASASAFIIRVLGHSARAEGKEIKSAAGSLDIKHGCDAIEPSAIFVSAVLASPIVFRRRFMGILVGTAILLTVNLIRIVSLYFFLVYWPEVFDIMHVEVWQAAFIFLAVFLWIVWARWAKRLERAVSNAPIASE